LRYKTSKAHAIPESMIHLVVSKMDLQQAGSPIYEPHC